MLKRKTGLLFFAVLLILSLVILLQMVSSGATTRTLYIDWDASVSANVSGYRVYIDSNYTDAQNLVGGINFYDVGNLTSQCVEIPVLYDSVFVAVTAYNAVGESEPVIGYWLYGDIYDEALIAQNYLFDGINPPYTQARVDGFDLSILGSYYGTYVDQPVYNCSNDFSLLTPMLEERSDINKSGRIDGFDLSILGSKYGNELQ